MLHGGLPERGRPGSRLRNWLQVLTRDRLDSVPILAEHLNVTAVITGVLLHGIKRVLAAKPQKTGCVRLRSNIPRDSIVLKISHVRV